MISSTLDYGLELDDDGLTFLGFIENSYVGVLWGSYVNYQNNLGLAD